MYFTVTASVSAGVRVTVKIMVSPSTAEAAEMLRSGTWSLALIVPVAETVAPKAAFDEGFDSVSVNVSADSSSVSSVVPILMVPVVCPAVIVSVWLLAAVKSPVEAVSSAAMEVSYWTVTFADGSQRSASR